MHLRFSISNFYKLICSQMALMLMSCSLLPYTTKAASVEQLNQIEVNSNIKQLKKKALQQQAVDTSISDLIKILEQKYRLWNLEDSPEAKAASKKLVEIGKPAVPELINALKKNRLFLTLGVSETLSKIAKKDSSVVPVLINKLGDKDSRVRLAIMKTLEHDSFETELKKAAQNKNPRIAAGAIYALGRARGNNSILLPLLNDKNKFIRRSAALGLVSSSRKKAAEIFTILKNALEDEDSFIRVNSALNLTFAMGYRDEISGIINFDDINKIAKVLVEGTEDKDSLIRSNALQAIRQIYYITYLYEIKTNPPIIPSIIKAVKDEDPGIRYVAMLMISMSGNATKAAIPLLMEALNEKDERIRGVAAFAFRGMGYDAKPAIPKIIAIFQNKEENEHNRRYALITLGNLKKNAVSAIPALITTIKDKENSKSIAISAAYALQKIDSLIVIPHLLKKLSEKDKNYRASWLRVLQDAASQIRRNKDDLSKPELEKVISELETALNIIENSEYEIPQHIASSLKKSIAELKIQKNIK